MVISLLLHMIPKLPQLIPNMLPLRLLLRNNLRRLMLINKPSITLITIYRLVNGFNNPAVGLMSDGSGS